MKPKPIDWTCPACGVVITVASQVATARTSEPGTLTVEVVPDLADAWAHVWSHEFGG